MGVGCWVLGAGIWNLEFGIWNFSSFGQNRSAAPRVEFGIWNFKNRGLLSLPKAGLLSHREPLRYLLLC
jgi:hypothetical protein